MALPVLIVAALGTALSAGLAGHAQYDRTHPQTATQTDYPWAVLIAGLCCTAIVCTLLWRLLDTDLLRRTAADLRHVTAQLNFLAERDPLTGLRNRLALLQWLDAWDLRHPGRELGLVYVDLTDFRQINATYGHISGDVVLREIARRLSVLSEDADSIVARLAGDHFVVARPANRGSLYGLALTVRTLIAEPVTVGDRDIRVASAVGVVVRPTDGHTLDALLGNADHATQVALSRSDRIAHFDAELAAERTIRQRLARDLRSAVQRPDENFHLVFQPQVDMRTGRLIAAEALLRWHHPQGDVPPARFIPLASDNGLIPALGRWVLREACRILVTWRTDAPAVVAVNVDARELDDGFAEQVAATLEHSGARPEWLIIEVTESAAMDPGAQRQLEQVRALGVGISIDDFGAGFSSLSRLTQVPAQQIKIDRDFIGGLTEPGSHNLEIVRTIAALAACLELQVLAEGVEDYEQAAALLAQGIHAAQGFVFCAPVDADTCLGLWSTGVVVPAAAAALGV